LLGDVCARAQGLGPDAFCLDLVDVVGEQALVGRQAAQPDMCVLESSYQ